MAWAAEIISVDVGELSADYLIRFTNEKITKEISFKVSDPDTIKRICFNQIEQYKKIDLLSSSPPLGPVDLSDFEPKIPPLPDPVEIARAKFVEDFLVYKKMLDLISKGLKKETDLDYITLITSIKERLAAHPEYQKYIPG